MTIADCLRAVDADLRAEKSDRRVSARIETLAAERERVMAAVSDILAEEGIQGGLKDRIVGRSRNRLQSSEEISDRRLRNRLLAIAGVAVFGMVCFVLGLNKPESVACSQQVSLCYLLRFDVWQGQR